MHQIDMACPQCGHVDQVTKVSAIVSASTQVGVQTGIGLTGGYAFLKHHSRGPIGALTGTFTRSTTQSVLVGRLSLAPQPATLHGPRMTVPRSAGARYCALWLRL